MKTTEKRPSESILHFALNRHAIRCAIVVLLFLMALHAPYQFDKAVASVHRDYAARIQQALPTPEQTPPEDTARYVEWMNRRGTPIKDQPHEEVSLRLGDWGFFYHGDRPRFPGMPFHDMVALDRSGHAIMSAENGDWYAFLSTRGLDAKGALRRIAWLFNAYAILTPSEPKEAGRARISAPTLTNKEGVITFQGWFAAHSDPPSPYKNRVTITATKDGAKLVLDTDRKP